VTHSSVDGSLWVERTVENHSVVVRAGGELDLRTAPILNEQLELAEAVVVPPGIVVLDLSEISFLGSAGLSVLLRHHERCEELGSGLRVVPGGRAVSRPLAMTGLDKVLTVVPGNRTPADDEPLVAD
jgi:anti-sigma B factor antagonist